MTDVEDMTPWAAWQLLAELGFLELDRYTTDDLDPTRLVLWGELPLPYLQGAERRREIWWSTSATRWPGRSGTICTVADFMNSPRYAQTRALTSP